MPFRIRITEEDVRQLERCLWARPGVESAAFLLAGLRESDDATMLIVRRVIEIPDSEYDVRSAVRIELSTRAINGLAALCEANGLVAIVAHSHPSNSLYSPSDDHGEERIARALRQFAPRPIMGSLLLTPSDLHGRVWTESTSPTELLDVTIVGRSLRRVDLGRGSPNSKAVKRNEAYARQILAFGEDGQAMIRSLRVGIVGVGGTGSPLAEELVRMGVQDVVLIDRDILVESNLSRVFGSRARDVRPSFWRRWFRGPGKPKVEAVACHLEEIDPGSRLRAVQGDMTNRRVAELLLDRDVLFACTDEHWGRSVVNQIAYQYLIPTLNLGAAIVGEEGRIEDGVGVVQVLRPGHGCLWCCGFLDSDRIRAESLPREERSALLEEGYLVGVDEPAPSVVSVTATVASLAATWFLQLATDFMGENGNLSRLNYNILTGEVRRGRIAPSEGCICHKSKGRGDLGTLPV